jgi:hypothetical protein
VEDSKDGKGRRERAACFLEGRGWGGEPGIYMPVTASRPTMLMVLEFYDVRRTSEVMTSPQVVSVLTLAGT